MRATYSCRAFLVETSKRRQSGFDKSFARRGKGIPQFGTASVALSREPVVTVRRWGAAYAVQIPGHRRELCLADDTGVRRLRCCQRCRESKQKREGCLHFLREHPTPKARKVAGALQPPGS